MTITKYNPPSRWPSHDEFATLMRMIGYAYETGYFGDKDEDALNNACQALLYAWQQGTISIEQPVK